MKCPLAIVLICSSILCFSQKASLKGAVLDSTLNDRPVTVQLLKGTRVIAQALAVNDGKFRFEDLTPGRYRLRFKRLGEGDFYISNIILKEGQTSEIDFNPAVACPYRYPKGFTPHCLKKPSDPIVPIVYGLPTRKTLARAKAGEVHLGGCLITGCDPKYYCGTHDLKF